MQHRTRAIWILVFLACGFTLISFNLIQIQLVQHDKFWHMAVENHLHPEEIEPVRGALFDADGNVLAQTQRVYDVRLDGQGVKRPDVELPQIAAALQVTAGSFAAIFNQKNRYQLIAHDVDDATATKLRALKLDCIITEQHDRRVYPNNELASHILGFTDDAGHGLLGMEKAMDAALRGTPGERLVERDGKKHDIAAYQMHETPAVNGDNVTLTIKTAIQHVVEDQLDQIAATYHPEAAYIIVMDPQNGEILAMSSRPTYDPNDRAHLKADNVRNRCITDGVEPGSVFKIITLSGALNEGLVDLNTPVFCENGSFYYDGKELRDDEPHGWLPVEEVMAQSSNIGFAKIAMTYLHEQKLYQYATAFGIGQRTGLFGDDQGESSGLFRPLSKWSGLSITRVPMGQEVLATPVQLVTAMSVIANGGKLIEPHLTKEITDPQGRVVEVFQPKVMHQVISPNAAREVAEALHQVTIDGTAKSIKIQDPATGNFWSFAGKTGTAQKFVDGEYSHDHHVASFIGFAPAQDPAFVTLVMVDDPKTERNKDYGAIVSAPVFATVAKQVAQIMNIPPDVAAPAPTPATQAISSNSAPKATL
jgi:cell division protein FtsI (penicillin-binding protein 3)/stage V sporulation protein D (sporulation-specific penicillin-binding protein)